MSEWIDCPENKFIPSKDYEQIIANVPIVCVDVLIKKGNKILLIKRSDEPCKGQWWLVGGRLYKNETPKHCAIRKAKEEVGIDCRIVRYLSTASTMFSTGYKNIPVHSINLIYLLEPISSKIKLDKTCENYKWVDISKKLKVNEYVKECLNF